MMLLPVRGGAGQLPPEVQADRYLLQAEREIREQDFVRAKAAMDGILELQAQHGLELPDEFLFRYAEVLERLALYDEAIEFVTRYLTAVGRGGAHYREALELLDSAEDTLRQVELERQLAEAERQRAEAQQSENDELARQIEEARIVLPPDELRSGGVGPEMVRIASGRFQFYTYPGYDNLHWVQFERAFAISRYEVTRVEFERFVDHSRYRTEADSDPKHGCDKANPTYGEMEERNSLRWNRPGFGQTDTEPVTCVSTADAIAYAEWLSRETGHTYRLPSAAEWQYAARAGSSSAMLFLGREGWAGDEPNVCRHGNLHDSSTGYEYAVECSDGARRTTEVGRFQPNDVGLHDMIGNVAELVMACAHPYYEGDTLSVYSLAANGLPERPDSCEEYVVALGSHWHSGRADSWDYYSKEWVNARPFRDGRFTRDRYRRSSETTVGFRIVRKIGRGDPAPWSDLRHGERMRTTSLGERTQPAMLAAGAEQIRSARAIRRSLPATFWRRRVNMRQKPRQTWTVHRLTTFGNRDCSTVYVDEGVRSRP